MKDCTTCLHEPRWEKPTGYTWLQGLCEKTEWVLNKRRTRCYSWECQIIVCPDWEAKVKPEKAESAPTG